MFRQIFISKYSKKEQKIYVILCRIISQNVKLAGQFTVIFWWCDLADGRFLVPEPEYSVQGHASATITHAAAHKAHILYIPDKTYVSLEYIIYGLKCRRG